MFWKCFSPSFDDASDYLEDADQEPFFQHACTHDLNNAQTENTSSVKAPFMNEKSTAFFGLFEGHRNGYIASQTASVSFPEYLRKELLAHQSSLDLTLDLKKCFINAYAQVDDHLKTIAYDRGTSATAWLIRKSGNQMRLHMSNVGCSRAVLCRGSEAVVLTQHHSESTGEEQSRLAACKAYTKSSPRVRQLLPSTRALGDHLLKDWVISTPHYTETDLTPDDSCIVCMTKNISDLISDEEVVELSQGEHILQIHSPVYRILMSSAAQE